LEVIRVTVPALQRLPEEILNWQRVLTHVHTDAGHSHCSGQQTIDDVLGCAEALGFEGVVFAEHTSNPERPRCLELGELVHGSLREAWEHVVDLSIVRRSFLRFGLECNTVPNVVGIDGRRVEISFELDVPSNTLDHLRHTYIIGSLHGDGGLYKHPATLMTALRMLCEHPMVHTLGHVTRHVSDVDIDWAEVAKMAADTGTLIELNLNLWFNECRPKNQPHPDEHFNVRFHRRFLEAVAGSSAMCVIGADIHNAGMWPTLNPAEGWEISVDSVVAHHQLLADCGLTPERVINSNRDRLHRWLATPKGERIALTAA
jgi:histidinol phosphatase-like PHP family hydrolase